MLFDSYTKHSLPKINELRCLSNDQFRGKYGESEMNNTNKYEYYYRQWEYHANLLWNKVQSTVVILVGIYTGWFILFQLFMDDNKYDYLYFILAVILNIFGIIICHNIFIWAKRDMDIQKYYEEKLPDIFGEIKNNKVDKKTRGKYIFQRLMKICIWSCTSLLVFSVICFFQNMVDVSEILLVM